MSDFLSQFEKGATKPSTPVSASVPPSSSVLPVAPPVAAPAASTARAQAAQGAQTLPLPAAIVAPAASGIEAVEHPVKTDPHYRRKLLLRAVIIVFSVLALAVLAVLIWHLSRLVEVPDLVGKPLSTAQTFCRDNGLELDATEEYSKEAERGIVLSQDVSAGENTTKGSTLVLVVSGGPDPDELLALPDFSTMKRSAAEQWIRDMRADNLRLVQEFSETVAADGFLRLEFRSNEVNAENYRRRDYATLYYSKGPEVFEKNITVLDFTDKPRGEAESWAQTNGLELTVEEADSDTVAVGNIISQSVAAGEKLAKRDAFSITVSLGKPRIVPDFSAYTMLTAPGAAGQIPVIVETRFHASVAYGRLISQSVSSGTRLAPDDDRQIIVVYSEGRPYLKDYRGSSEGDLPATFFNDYTAKGANVSYELRYVDSSEPKGTVVGMSDFSCFIPMNFHVVVDISLGNLTPPPMPDDSGGGNGNGNNGNGNNGSGSGSGNNSGLTPLGEP
ncbi:MAG: PASTA domain-containing protein [Coriobacteriales bacterium]|nr:PASTA domain-containing protein [Coriobacteriales bacterium]